MWEIIRKNKRRSWMLLGVMGLLLVTLGFLIGAAVHLETSSIVDIPYGMRDYGRMIERTAEGYDPGPPPGFFSWTRAPELLLNGGGMIGIGVAVLVW
ncbi:MAG TPA: hypothetical protein VNT79_03650, partial [Phycisphaerae bacterium]|nr:hypothetical protein [Phycisphaerae bacterium]